MPEVAPVMRHTRPFIDPFTVAIALPLRTAAERRQAWFGW